MTLAEESGLPDANIPSVYLKGDELGKNITLVGWGASGNVTGQSIGASDLTQDDTFRLGYNVITNIKDGLLLYRLTNGPDNTVMAAAGDSGGPMFIQTQDELFVAGVNTKSEGEYCCNWNTRAEAKRLSDHWDWIQEILKKTYPLKDLRSTNVK